MELDAVADLEDVRPAAISWLRHRCAQITHEVGRRGRIVRINADQHAVEGCRRLNGRKGGLAMRVKARRGVCWDYIGQKAAVLWRFLRERDNRPRGDESAGQPSRKV